ncbi:MAG: hypothetical protein K0R65_2943 [Crocinitomicaceae bacterium]|jgi:hypothetical protein|nr:hypothetical protein [Crocinitomicaceae bacterium]
MSKFENIRIRPYHLARISCIVLIQYAQLLITKNAYFENGGIYIGKDLSFYCIAALLLAFLLFAVSSYSNASKGIFKEF